MLQGCRLFKWCRNLPLRHCGARFSNWVWTYLLGTVEQGCRLFKRCQFLPPEQVRWAELDILLFFNFRTDKVKPWHMQLLLLRSAFFFLRERSIQFRMSTSDSGSIFLLNKESLHLISVDPIWKFKIVWCESQETKLNAVWHIFNSFASCRFKKNILHWALKETDYRSISDEYRCDFTLYIHFSALRSSIYFSAEVVIGNGNWDLQDKSYQKYSKQS